MKLRTKLVIGVCAGLSIIGTAAIAVAANDDTRTFDPSEVKGITTPGSFSALSNGNGTRMTPQDYAAIKATVESEGAAKSGVDASTLSTIDKGSVLLDVPAARLSAVSLSDRDCYAVTFPSTEIVTSCPKYFQEGVDANNSWTQAGHSVFGLMDDSVKSVAVRTNLGTSEDAEMGQNSYYWSANSSSREKYGVELTVVHSDGTANNVNLPIDDKAVKHPYLG